MKESRREARLLSKLKHPYIVRYHESFAERGTIGWLCIVMDYCDGGDITAQIERAAQRRAPISEECVQKWTTQALLALKYLHGKHVLHRDLKPSNLFLMRSGDVRVGDFGISKVLTGTHDKANTILGTPNYISPELVQERPYSWPSDIWAMGCILYQMCALRVPFEAPTIQELARKIVYDPIPQLPGMYSRDLRTLCTLAMRRDPARRPSADQIINTPLVQDAVRRLLEEKRSQQEAEDADVTSAATSADAAQHLEGMPHERPPDSLRHEVMHQFRQIDRNGDGLIDAEELAEVLRNLDSSTWDDARIRKLIIKGADMNEDDRLDYEEFLQWIFGSREHASAEVPGRCRELASQARRACG